MPRRRSSLRSGELNHDQRARGDTSGIKDRIWCRPSARAISCVAPAQERTTSLGRRCNGLPERSGGPWIRPDRRDGERERGGSPSPRAVRPRGGAGTNSVWMSQAGCLSPAPRDFLVVRGAETAQVADVVGTAILPGHDVIDTRSPPAAACHDTPVSVAAQAGSTQPAPLAREVERVRHGLGSISRSAAGATIRTES